MCYNDIGADLLHESKKEELNKFKTYVTYDEDYRVVYYYEKYHEVPKGLYAKKIEDFMIEFCESYPIMCEEEIPKFESTDDILHRCLINIKDINKVAIYDVKGKLIAKKEKTKDNIK